MYIAIVITWIIFPAYLTTLGYLTTAIIGTMCIPWGAFSGQAVENGMIFSQFFVVYIVPLTIMLCCYSRIVYVLAVKPKVTDLDLDHPTPAGALGDETFPPTPIAIATLRTPL